MLTLSADCWKSPAGAASATRKATSSSFCLTCSSSCTGTPEWPSELLTLGMLTTKYRLTLALKEPGKQSQCAGDLLASSSGWTYQLSLFLGETIQRLMQRYRCCTVLGLEEDITEVAWISGSSESHRCHLRSAEHTLDNQVGAGRLIACRVATHLSTAWRGLP